jgi:hypothetical protein
MHYYNLHPQWFETLTFKRRNILLELTLTIRFRIGTIWNGDVQMYPYLGRDKVKDTVKYKIKRREWVYRDPCYISLHVHF